MEEHMHHETKNSQVIVLLFFTPTQREKRNLIYQILDGKLRNLCRHNFFPGQTLNVHIKKYISI